MGGVFERAPVVLVEDDHEVIGFRLRLLLRRRHRHECGPFGWDYTGTKAAIVPSRPEDPFSSRNTGALGRKSAVLHGLRATAAKWDPKTGSGFRFLLRARAHYKSRSVDRARRAATRAMPTKTAIQHASAVEGLNAGGSADSVAAMPNDSGLAEERAAPDVFPGIYLGNAELRAAQDPETFEIPPADVRALLRPRDHAKLLFIAHVPVNGFVAERMWVQITSRSAGRYTGTVDNRAAFLAVPFGGLVTFGPEHILDVATQEDVR